MVFLAERTTIGSFCPISPHVINFWSKFGKKFLIYGNGNWKLRYVKKFKKNVFFIFPIKIHYTILNRLFIFKNIIEKIIIFYVLKNHIFKWKKLQLKCWFFFKNIFSKIPKFRKKIDVFNLDDRNYNCDKFRFLRIFADLNLPKC